MDPVTLTVIGSALGLGISAGSLLVGYLLGRRRTRKAQSPQVQKELDDAKQQLAWHEERRGEWEADLERMRAQRDEYRRIAETHEVKMPEAQDPQVTKRQVWKDRRYTGHPERNLVNLKEELRPYWNKEVVLVVNVVGSGPYVYQGRYLKEAGWKNQGRLTADLGPFIYHGPASRAMQEFETFILDVDTGLCTGRGSEGLRWKDGDSPILFKVTLDVIETVTWEAPAIHTVEVAVVQEDVQRVVIEKPVMLPLGQSQEYIRALVEDSLARRAAEVEVNSLERDKEAALERIRQRVSRGTSQPS